MPEFAYVARGLDGKDISGLLKAGSEREAMSALSQRALFPLKVESLEAKPLAWRVALPWQYRIGSEQLANCFSQLADLLENGVSLLASLELVTQQSEHAVLQQVLGDVRNRVADGTSLYDAMAQHRGVFSDLTVSMVRAGSEGGFLEDALRRVADFLQLQQQLKDQVKGAMAYPAFLGAAGSVGITALMMFVVPRFQPLFDRLERAGSGLPLATESLLGLSDLLSRYGIVFAVALAACFVGIRKLLGTDHAKTFVDRWKLKLPVVGKIFHATAVSRFCRILGTLLHNDVPILKSLQISSASAGNRLLAEAIVASAENVSTGETLSGPLAQCGLIPRSIMAMIRVAEESNNLDTVLVNIADRLDQKTERQLSVMVRFIEPLMLLVLGLAVLFILVALLLPVIELTTAF